MSNLTLRINGGVIKEVTGISYLEGISKLRVVTKLGGLLVSEDYDADDIAIDITCGSMLYNKLNVGCVYKASDTDFKGLKGRYNCVSVTDRGIVKIVDCETLHWVDLKILVEDVETVKNIASSSMGSLYVDVSEKGLGKIYNRTMEEDLV